MVENIPEKSNPGFKPEDDLSSNVETINVREVERVVVPEQNLNESMVADQKKSEESDQQRLMEVRESLGLETEKSNGWEVIRRPIEQWKQEQQITTDSPIEKFRDWLKSFSKSERESRRSNEKLQNDFRNDRAKYPETGFDYKKGIGVEGMVGNKVGILAKGFGECSGLVFQTPDKVAVVHISPNVFKDVFEGGERVQDKDVWGHIKSALKELLIEEEKATARKTDNNTDLSEEQIAKLQKMVNSGDLKSTMLSGEDILVPHGIVTELGKLAKFRGLPFMKPEIHYVGAMGGGDGYAIYANPEDMYFIGSNNKVMKKGDNLPPTMYEYQEKKR